MDDIGLLKESTKNRSNWQDSVVQMVANVLFQHRVQLASAFRLFDVNNEGQVDAEDFRKAMRTANAAFPEPLSNAQIHQLTEALVDIQTGKIDYKDFLDSFQIIDVAWTTSLESSSLKREKRRRRGSNLYKK